MWLIATVQLWKKALLDFRDAKHENLPTQGSNERRTDCTNPAASAEAGEGSVCGLLSSGPYRQDFSQGHSAFLMDSPVLLHPWVPRIIKPKCFINVANLKNQGSCFITLFFDLLTVSCIHITKTSQSVTVSFSNPRTMKSSQKLYWHCTRDI